VETPGAGPAAPAVVAVVVTHDPGPWFDTVLRSLGEQDYPNLSILVIDAASQTDPTPRIGAILPSAYVRRVEANAGYGATANEVLHVVEGAAFFLFCHDDVAPAPDAVRLLVEEAFRSNAGVVGPKLVRWDDPRRLLAVGELVDKTGVPLPLVERDELDQEQHDAVRDVFAVTGGCTLLRADLFAAIGGFDAGIDFLGDDVNLCWRVHLAGARVVVAPAASVRHLEALGDRRPTDDRRRLQGRHRLRTILTCYSRWSLVRVLPQAAFLATIELLYALLVGRTRQAGDIVSAWRWNLGNRGDLQAARRKVQAARQVGDHELRRLQTRGSARLTLFLRGQIGRGEDRFAAMNRAGRDLAGGVRDGQLRTTALVLGGVAAVVLFGSRHLLTRGMPALGEFQPFVDGPFRTFGQWTTGWRTAGLGSESPAPTAFALLGLAGTVFLGAMGALRSVLVLGLVPAGAIGAWRLAGPTGSRAARLVTVVVYLSIPVPYNALATGSWSGLALWAAAPFLLRRLAAAGRLAPFGRVSSEDGAPAAAAAPLWAQAVSLGLLVAVIGALVPSVVAVVVLLGLALAAGSFLTGRAEGAGRVVAVAAGAAVVAAVLHIPWTFDFLAPGRQWSAFAGVSHSADRPLTDFLRFHTGPIGATPLDWAFLVAAALPLVIGRRWRLAWAIRCWSVALVCWGLLWVAEQGWLPGGAPHPEVLLAPAAAALAFGAGLGMDAFQVDLPGYRFGWRQLASLAAAVAVVAGTLPILTSSLGGRWYTPRGDFRRTLAFLDDQVAGAHRVLWIGDPDVVPASGWKLEEGVVYATTDQGRPRVQDLWAGTSDGATELIADALHVAGSRQTARLGRLLAPMGIQYIVVPLQVAPVPFTDDQHRPPAAITDSLAGQLDLERVEVNPGVIVYRNAAFVPERALLTGDGAEVVASSSLAAAVTADLSSATPVLPHRAGAARFTGTVPSPGTVYVANASSSRWQLRSGGETAERDKALGWANRFAVTRPGDATLRFRTPLLRYLLLFAQLLLWVVAVQIWIRARPAEHRPADASAPHPGQAEDR
jgi:GT2 family glycosyltransferase